MIPLLLSCAAPDFVPATGCTLLVSNYSSLPAPVTNKLSATHAMPPAPPRDTESNEETDKDDLRNNAMSDILKSIARLRY